MEKDRICALCGEKLEEEDEGHFDYEKDGPAESLIRSEIDILDDEE